ncbi:MAG TPA: NifU family protein, partial [Acidobacteriota bacterium]|nr:NifU family protein [Acidobacteriota bacterium]
MHDQETEEGRMVCKCFSLTEPYIKRKIRELNLRTISEITNAIKAGGGCSSCHHIPGGLQDLLDQVWEGKPAEFVPAVDATVPEKKRDAAEFSPFQFAKQVEKVMDEYIRPSLQMDGGDVEILDIKGMLIYCRLKGACAHCMGAKQTLKMLVERILKEQVDERIQVIEV